YQLGPTRSASCSLTADSCMNSPYALPQAGACFSILADGPSRGKGPRLLPVDAHGAFHMRYRPLAYLSAALPLRYLSAFYLRYRASRYLSAGRPTRVTS